MKMKSKSFLAWCPKHAFVAYTELYNVTYMPFCSCGCSVYGVQTIRKLSEAIKIVSNIRHATWHKDLSLGKDLKFHIVGYRDHFWKLKILKDKINSFFYNLTHLFNERE